MNLQDYPSELISLLFEVVPSHYVIMLWKCGNRLLNSKMKNGAIKCIELRREGDGPSRWPRCLKEFKLERLSVTSRFHPLCTTEALRKELQQLHRGLKALSIDAPNAIDAFFDFSIPDDPPADPRPLKRSKHLEAKDEGAIHKLRWNLDSTWPLMERLSISCVSHDFEDFVPFFALLPRSLVHIRLHICADGRPITVGALPPRLETLDLDSIIFEDALPLLPKSLTDLGRTLSRCACLALYRNPSLFPNLVWLPALKEGEWPLDLPCPPNNVRSLQWCNNHNNNVHVLLGSSKLSLPSELEVLKIMVRYFSPGIPLPPLITSFRLASMPKTLTELTLVLAIDWPNIALHHWPSNLRSLHLDDPSFGPCWYFALPRTLTSLAAVREDRHVPSPVQRRPTPATDLTLEQGRNALDLGQWTSLKARQLCHGNNRLYIKAVESGLLFGLPLTLSTLVLAHYDIYIIPELIIPPRVTKLELMNPALDNWTQFLELLPASLTSLTISDRIHSRPSFFDYIYTLSGRDPRTTALYNLSNLRSLRLSYSNSSLIKYLPPHLKSLNLGRLYHDYWFPPTTDFALLPRGLETLQGALVHVTLNGLLQAPRSLTSFKGYVAVEGQGSQEERAARPDLLTPLQLNKLLDAFQPFFTIFDVPREVLEFEMGIHAGKPPYDDSEDDSESDAGEDYDSDLGDASSDGDRCKDPEVDARLIRRLYGLPRPPKRTPHKRRKRKVD